MAEETDEQPITLAIPEGAVTRSESQIRVKGEGFRQIYANNIQIGFSSFDMGIAFGQIVGEEEGKTVVEELVRVLLPRELAKVFAGLLLGNIQAYEQQFGEIKIPMPLMMNVDETEQDEEKKAAPDQLMAKAVKKTRRPK